MLIMSSNVYFNCVCVLLFLLLAVKVDSQGIEFPSTNENNGSRDSSDCNCIFIRRCPALRNRPNWRVIGKNCGYKIGEYRKVCCPSTSKPPVGKGLQPQNPESGVCGLSSYPEDSYKPLLMIDRNMPWMVAIRMRETTGYYSPWCSGFLIDRKHVISAAHCYHERGDDRYRARIGSINQNTADEYRITKIDVPAGYTNGQFYDDIAILTLDREVNFPNFNPVCLPNEEVSRMNLNNRGTTVAGWGADRNGSEMSVYLQYVDRLPVISNPECQRKLRRRLKDSFQRQFPRGVSRGFICAAFKEGNKDDCGADSGGPQMIRSGDRWYAIGVASFGFRCGIPDMPGGYTRIANYIEWIREHTKN